MVVAKSDAHPGTRGWGSYSKNLGELSLVDYDSTPREVTPLGEQNFSSRRV